MPAEHLLFVLRALKPLLSWHQVGIFLEFLGYACPGYLVLPKHLASLAIIVVNSGLCSVRTVRSCLCHHRPCLLGLVIFWQLRELLLHRSSVTSNCSAVLLMPPFPAYCVTWTGRGGHSPAVDMSIATVHVQFVCVFPFSKLNMSKLQACRPSSQATNSTSAS